MNFNRKKKKKVSEIKININGNVIMNRKTTAQIFKFMSIKELCEFISEIQNDIRLKILINYKDSKFYVFKTESTKGKRQLFEPNQLDTKEIASLFKGFYSQDEFNFDESFFKKSKKMIKKLKCEIAPTDFEVDENYLVSEDRYINGIYIEHLDSCLKFDNIIKNMDSWLSIDCYKIDKEFISNKLAQMKEDNVLEKKFTNFIVNRLDDITEKINTENIFQCEVKVLLYGSNLEDLNSENEMIRNNISNNYCTSYIPQERINTRKLFEKCIYPNLNMDIIHSISDSNLFNMIGSDN